MPELQGDHVVLRPLEPADGPELRRIRATPEVSTWWGLPEDGFPESDEPETTRYTVLVEGRIAGLIQYLEEPEPDARYAEIDIYLDARVHGRGVGTDAVRTMARHLIEDRGHHRLVIAPQVSNAAAIRSYEKAGFRPVGVTHLSFRDPSGEWQDELYMELVVPPRQAGQPSAGRSSATAR